MITDGRQRRSERSRQAVVAACRELFARGTLRPTVEGIAAHAGCSMRTVYHHFASLAALYHEVLDDGLRRILLGHILGGQYVLLTPEAQRAVIAAAIFGVVPAWPLAAPSLDLAPAAKITTPELAR